MHAELQQYRTARPRVRSPRQARWLPLRKDDDLDEEDLAYRDQSIASSDEIQTAKHLADDFGKIIRKLDVPGLHMWMGTALSFGIGMLYSATVHYIELATGKPSLIASIGPLK